MANKSLSPNGTLNQEVLRKNAKWVQNRLHEAAKALDAIQKTLIAQECSFEFLALFAEAMIGEMVLEAKNMADELFRNLGIPKLERVAEAKDAREVTNE